MKRVTTNIISGSGSFAKTPTVTIPDQTNYSQGQYIGYLSPWSVVGNSSYVHGRDYADTLIATPASFPSATTINWQWPSSAPPTGGDVWAYLQVALGNYDGGIPQTAVAPRQVKYLTSLSSALTWSHTGSNFFNLLAELYLTSAEGDPNAKLFEVGFFLHTPASTITFHNSGAAVGTFTDVNGVAWDCRNHGGPVAYITFMKTGGAETLTANLDFKGALQFLQSKSLITGNEWVNGQAVGIEPTTGAATGSATFTSVAMTLAGTRGALEILGTPTLTATQNSPYAFTPAVNNGTKPYTFSKTGTLPAGLSFSTTTGAITGSPTASGTFSNIVISVKDATNTTVNLASFNLTVNAAVANNIVTNGDFANGATGWIGGGYGGMDISNGTMNFASGPQFDGFTQPLTLTVGKTYAVTYTVSSYTSGTVRFSFTGGTQKDGAQHSAAGTFTDNLVAATGNNTLIILALATAGTNTFKIDNISVVQTN